MTTPIYSLALAINATLDMHDLNNEGSEGNQLQTRMVDVIGTDGALYNVNAISGDMLKHIQAEHFFNLARQRGLPLCAGCRQFNPNRINADSDFIARTKQLSDAETLDELLRVCAMDDVVIGMENSVWLPMLTSPGIPDPPAATPAPAADTG